MISNWIPQGNLEPFLTVLGWIIGYTFDKDEWHTITVNDLLDGGGGKYELSGTQKTKLGLSINRDTKFVDMTIETPSELEPQVELAFSIFQNFHLKKLRGPQSP